MSDAQPSSDAQPRMEQVQRDEIVVDLGDVGTVTGLLAEWGVEFELLGTIPAFRVQLISVVPPHVDTPEGASAGGAGDSDLDRLLRRIREHIRRPADDEPWMGKNRDMDLMEGLPHTGGGEGDPAPAQAFDIPTRSSVVGRGLKIGVLDTAMFPHPRLAGRYLSDDLVTAEEPFHSWAGHAAFVAGRILTRAPAADIDVRQVLNSVSGTASAWEVATEMASFLGSGVEILNVSLGGLTADNKPPFLMQRAVACLRDEMVVVAAAGNHGDNRAALGGGAPPPTAKTWPAGIEGVVSVGSEAQLGEPAEFTPTEAWFTLWAPGKDVVSTFVAGEVQTTKSVAGQLVIEWLGPFNGYATWSGTSFSVADVVGEIAALAQEHGETAQQALDRLTGRDPNDLKFDVRPTV